MSGRPWNEPPWWSRNWRAIGLIVLLIAAAAVAAAAVAWRMW